MTAPPDAVANLYKLVAELEQRLESSFAAHDAAIARQVATDRENARLIGELAIARERQDASADILSTIANASGDAAASLQRIAETTARLFDAASVSIRIADGNEWGLSIRVGVSEERIAAAVPMMKVRIGGRNLPGTVVAENRQIHIPDLDNVDPDIADWPGLPPARAAGTRVLAGTPLRREGMAIGVLIVHRDRPEPFTAEELALQQSFADQAAIALENARLFNETRQALERQNASAAILRTIASAPGDAERALYQIAETSARLFGAPSTTIHIAEGDGWAKTIRFGDSSKRVGAGVPEAQLKIGGRNMPGTIVGDNRQVNIPDVDNVDPSIADWPGLPYVRAAGTRSTSGSPLRREGKAIGALIVYRDRLAPFTDAEMALQQTFADQAAIAIENARLFNETREALERQTATSDILKVIASAPSDVQPVFEAIVDSSKRLLGGFSAAVFRFIEGIAYLEAITPTNPAADEILKNSFPRPVADFSSFAIVQGGKIVQVPDTEAVSDDIRDIARGRGFRSMLLAPLMSSGTPIGLVSVTRLQAGTFAAHHEQLLQTFADQAVIAIENVRLFNEVQQRTNDLSESLQQQTAVGDVLKTISRSTFDLQPVLDTLVNTAALLCDAEMAFIMRREGDEYRAGAAVGYSPEYIDYLKNHPLSVDRGTITGRAVLERRTVQILDVAADPEYTLLASTVLAHQHTALCVPLLRENEPIGTIVLARQRVEAFTQKQIDLVTTFADQAVIAIENVRLFDELHQRTEDLGESLQQQTATADVLKVIASSPTDVEPALKAIVESACTLCDAYDANVLLKVGNDLHFSAHHGPIPTGQHPRPINREWVVGRSVVDKVPVQVSDFEAPEAAEFPEGQRQSREQGHRCTLSVPLLREGEAIGALVLRRLEPVAFTEKQMALLQTFADQAVIAIENARLFNETKEALEQQQASANILRVVANSVADTQPVFDEILNSIEHLFDAEERVIFLAGEDGLQHIGAIRGPSAERVRAQFPAPLEGTASEIALRERRLISSADVFNDPEIPAPARERARQFGNNYAMAVAPMLWEDRAVGSILVARASMVPFSEKECNLLRSFADQAVIAIQNARLFDEVQARTNELSESLQQQTATADVLKVISRSAFDLQSVFQTLVGSAAQLCRADRAAIFRLRDDRFQLIATHGFAPEFRELMVARGLDLDRGSVTGRAALERRAVQVADILVDPEFTVQESQRRGGFRTVLAVPLLREGNPIGALFLTRGVVELFTQQQIDLVTTFADQAVIAIENVRLFDEVQQRTNDLSESLQQQTATADVLKVISRSAFDLQTVLDTLVESAARLCEADMAAITRQKDNEYFRAGSYGFTPEFMDYVKDIPVRPERATITGRTLLEGKVTHVPDVHADPDYSFTEAQRLSGDPRTFLGVPLLREGNPVGALVLLRKAARPFTDKQIELVTTFADQAVIAIENVRLFDEVQAKTRDLTEALTYQTGSGKILSVIASSPTEVEPVLNAIVESACELCEAYDAVVLLKDGDHLRFRAHHGPIGIYIESWPINRNWTAGRAFLDRKPVHVQDMLSDEGAEFPDSRELSRHTGTAGIRSILAVPLLSENESIGTILLRRTEVQPFSGKQIALLQTFADQAVIAIGNVRLFDEVQAKTRDLSEALTYQTGSGNILRVIASSPTDVKPVLDAIVESACELCEANDALASLRDGDELVFQAQHGSIPVVWERQPVDRQAVAGLAVIDRRPVHVHDLLAPEGEQFPRAREFARTTNVRTVLCVPLLREGDSIGVIVLRRTEVRPFSDKQIALLQTFADQAVIAIGNVRLFEEVQQRTRELSESLEQQTATSEVLSVISRSAGDLEPVFQSMLENATRICGAQFGLMNLYEDGSFHTVGFHNVPRAFAAARAQNFKAHPDSDLGQMVLLKKVVHIDDLRTRPAYLQGDPATVQLADLAGARTILIVPMVKDDEFIGTIGIYRLEVSPFSEKQVSLLSSFASQAVIAIENTRLLKELRERTDDLTRSLDNLRTAQDRLVQTEKLASLGQLTAGIAHEIKNPLNFVNNFAALSAELTDELNDVLKQAEIAETIRGEVDELTGLLKDNLQKVVQHGKRADSIVKNMLLHSREGSGDHRPTDINALVDESLNLAYHGARAEKPNFNVTLRRDLDASAGTVEVFPQEITRVFLNLVSNGFYAVAKRKAEAGEGGFDPVLSAATRDLGDAVEIRIRDNGTGIPQDVRDKMFNPFFTTKPAGEGTGLGLSMSHDIIVKQHGGTIDVITEPGHFTEFIIVLPRTGNPPKTRGQS